MRCWVACLVVAASLAVAVPAGATTVTCNEYARLDDGMTVREVERLFGGPGALVPTVNLGPDAVSYAWRGENRRQTVTVTFAFDRSVAWSKAEAAPRDRNPFTP